MHREIANLELKQFHLPDFGRDFFKDQRLSPDASFQVTLQVRILLHVHIKCVHRVFTERAHLQLAYIRTHGHNCGTYETGSTRKFHHGRTDTIRHLITSPHASHNHMTSCHTS